MNELVISQAGEQVTITLDTMQGELLRQLIEQNTDRSFSAYLHTVGLLPNNVYPMLSGRRKISLKALRRLISNSPLEVECRVEFIVRKTDGEDAQIAACASLEELLSSEGMDELEREVLTERAGTSTGTENQQ